MTEIDERVRDLAYRLWEEAGRPEGRAEEFWFIALREVTGAAPEDEAAAEPQA
jgi:hypothetical protein